jgi:hypothetical protein
MGKLHLASDDFLDPILPTVPGVGFVRPYAVVKAWGGNTDLVHRMCNSGELPHIRLKNKLFVLVDFRDDPEGKGGKFYTSTHFPNGIFPYWTNSQYTRPPIRKSNPARDYLLRMESENE